MMTMTTSPLNIALLMHSLNPRGGVVHTLELADALCALGHAVTVFAPATPGQALFRPTQATLSIAPVHSRTRALVPMIAARMAAMAAHLRDQGDLRQFDVLHSQDSISANALATLKDEGRITGFVRTVHHLDEFDDVRLAAWQARGVREASQCLCVSRLWQTTLACDWDVDATPVPNGVNLTRFTADIDQQQAQADARICDGLGIHPDGPVWLAVGGIEARKNTVRLLQAFIALQDQAPNSQLVIAGGASLLDHDEHAHQFKQVLRDHGMAPGQARAHQVRITGPLLDEALPALYRRATALAMPSLREGFGLVALEALACGTPAIVSRMAPFTEHFAPHQVLWADPLSVDDIRRALLASLDPTQTQGVLEHARGVCLRMSWAASAQRHELIYRALRSLARPSGSSGWPTHHPQQAQDHNHHHHA